MPIARQTSESQQATADYEEMGENSNQCNHSIITQALSQHSPVCDQVQGVEFVQLQSEVCNQVPGVMFVNDEGDKFAQGAMGVEHEGVEAGFSKRETIRKGA